MRLVLILSDACADPSNVLQNGINERELGWCTLIADHMALRASSSNTLRRI